jgi:hypothetical protein
MVKIVHGRELFETNVKQNVKYDKKETAYDTEEKGPNRKRFKLSDVPSTDKPRWQRLYEAVVLDYIQKGPDEPAHDGEGRRRTDDRATIQLIKARYAQIFCQPKDLLMPTDLQIEGVHSLIA